MKISRNRLLKFSGLVFWGFAAFMSASFSANATDHQDQCFNNIQGKIPWNKEKNMNWDPANIKQLCGDTKKPEEPGACFLSVQEGQVNWGGGIDWEWKNIINLCAGTNDAKKNRRLFSTSDSQRFGLARCHTVLSKRQLINHWFFD